MVVEGTSWENLELRVRWKVNTYKCIDASPLLVIVSTPPHRSAGLLPVLEGSLPPNGGSGSSGPLMGVSEVSTVVYVGSHSHQFLAVETGSGRVLWRTELGGRVESSACPSLCGKYVIVGECGRPPSTGSGPASSHRKWPGLLPQEVAHPTGSYISFQDATMAVFTS